MPAAPDDPIARDLRAAVDDAVARLAGVPDETAARRPAPGTWSAKEVVGHLVDSAANNHGRFVRARSEDDLVFPTYDQDAWVAAGRYQEADWRELLELWRAYNRLVARVIESCPEPERTRPRVRHNLHRLAWRTVPEDEPATLEYFMRDYVGHLRHHLAQAYERTGVSA